MDSFALNILCDPELRDHEYTLRGLEENSLAAGLFTECRTINPRTFALEGDAAEAPADPFSLTRAISLDLEFADHAELRGALFLLDDATDLMGFSGSPGRLDLFADLPRIAALDVRAWAFYRSILRRDIELLPAPLPGSPGGRPRDSGAVVVLVNDPALAAEIGDEISRIVSWLRPEVEIVDLVNSYRDPAPQRAWRDARLPGAGAHVHIGRPPDTISAGRLIDSMNMGAPCIVFDEAPLARDADVPLRWERPAYANDVNIVQASTIRELSQALSAVLREPTWAQTLRRNAFREVSRFREQLKNALAAALQ